MKTNGKALLKRLAKGKRDDRVKTSLYLSKRLYEDFKRSCGQVPASTVLEELLEDFVKSIKEK